MTTKAQHFNALVKLCMDTKRPAKVDLDRLAAAVQTVSGTCATDFKDAAFMFGCGRNMEATDDMKRLAGRIYRQFPGGDFKQQVAAEYLKQKELTD